jgi:hypothetical protein
MSSPGISSEECMLEEVRALRADVQELTALAHRG